MKIYKFTSSKSFVYNANDAPAWAAIAGISLCSGLLIVIGAGKILNLFFPTFALAVGLFLYFRYPIIYMGFTWWIWFLNPLIRRLADYKSGYTDPSPILLSPYLVTLISIITLWRNLPRAHLQQSLPFILSLTGILYGFLIGLINRSILTVCIALLDWLAPVLWGFHLFASWREYPNYSKNVEKVFVWGALVLGLYGIFQYLVAPEWDNFWIVNSGLSSVGKPIPFGIRVWSTLNAPGPFATVMTACLLLVFRSKSSIRFLSTSVGSLSFLLSLVRSAWAGCFLGLLTLMASLKSSLQIRLVLTLSLVIIFAFPLAIIEPFSEVIQSRVETFSNIEEDTSVRARKETYARLVEPALASYIGEGIGGKSNDSALLDMLLYLGWFGTSFYMGGMLLSFTTLVMGYKNYRDTFAVATYSIVVATAVKLAFGSVMLSVNGIILWGFIGIARASQKYYIIKLNTIQGDLK